MFSNTKKLFYKLILILLILSTSKVIFSSETNLIKSLTNRSINEFCEVIKKDLGIF